MSYIKNLKLIHDNLNDIWLIADISNNKYKFYHTYNNKFVGKKNEQEKKNKTNLLSFDIKIAAILILMIIFGSIGTKTNEKIYDKYNIQSEYITNSRGNTYDSNLIKAKELYDNHNYEEAITYFKISNNKNNILPTFYIGNCYQNLNKPKYAIEEYKKVIANKENTLIEISEFNIGLCHLMNNDNESAIKQFEKIIIDNNYYKNYAKKILKKLKYQ